MKNKKRKFIILLFIIAVFIYLIAVFKDRLLYYLIDAAATRIVGTDVTIESLSLDILDSSVHIKGFKMYNPEGFSKEVLIDMPKIDVEYDLSALLKKNLHLVSAEIVLKELLIIKDKEGRVNLNSLKSAQKDEGRHPAPTEEADKPMPMHIDLLKLEIGRLIHKDFSRGDKPVVEVYDINIKKAYKNISSANQLITLMLVESLKLSAIKGVQLYGFTALTGVAALPVGMATVLISQDSVKAVFQTAFEEAYKVSLEATDELGDIVKTDQSQGYIKGRIQGTEVIVRIYPKAENKIDIVVSARKYFFPKLKTAEGLLYEISQKLKQAP